MLPCPESRVSPFPSPEPGCEWTIKRRCIRLVSGPGSRPWSRRPLFFFLFTQVVIHLFPFRFVTNDKIAQSRLLTSQSIGPRPAALARQERSWSSGSSGVVHSALSISIGCCFLPRFPSVCLFATFRCILFTDCGLSFFFSVLFELLLTLFITTVAIRVDLHQMPVAGIAN